MFEVNTDASLETLTDALEEFSSSLDGDFKIGLTESVTIGYRNHREVSKTITLFKDGLPIAHFNDHVSSDPWTIPSLLLLFLSSKDKLINALTM